MADDLSRSFGKSRRKKIRIINLKKGKRLKKVFFN